MTTRMLLLAELGVVIASAQAPNTAAATTAPAQPALTIQAPTPFYDPPANVPKKPGVLVRTEQLKGTAIPKGTRGWRILYTTSVNDKTPATAVAIVLAPTNPPPGPRPV